MARLPGPARVLASLMACAVVLAAAGPAAADDSVVPLARDATAKRIVDVALQSVAARQRETGLFDDWTGRAVGGEGLPSLAFVALARADEDGQRPERPSQTAAIRDVLGPVTGAATTSPDTTPATTPAGTTAGGGATAADDGSWRLTLARRTLARGSGSTVILRWPLAMLLAGHLEDLLVGEGGALRGKALLWGRLHAAGIATAADRCYQSPTCFDNYKVADAVLNLELVRTGLHSHVLHARLRDPAALRRAALHFLTTIPASVPEVGHVDIPGRPSEPAMIISDPGTRPLAYAALCTAWVVRATRLAGAGAPAALRRLARRALWGLLGATGPDGDISWSGRGQGQAWANGASLYAAAAGAALFADTDPPLAARLRRLADVQLAALDARVRAGELQVVPSGNDQLAGFDHYYSVTGSTGLALAFIQMARAELPSPDAPRLGLPAEIDAASFTDPGIHLVTRRAGLSWIALRTRRDHTSDPRSDAGLVRALRLVGGAWREQLPERPGPVSRPGKPAQNTPSGGPVLVVGATRYQPRATTVRQLAGGVDLSGVWQSAGGGQVAGSWRYTAAPDGVALRSVCPLGTRLELTEWFPRRGALVRDGGLVQRAGYAVRVAPRPKIRALVTNYANTVQPSLRAYRLVVPCSAPFASVTWSGGAVAPGVPST